MPLKSFTVSGNGYFPMDMLRYDKCYPATPDDTMYITEYKKERKVNLKGIHNPTLDRWASFGWKVLP